jgi:hypothetical protein
MEATAFAPATWKRAGAAGEVADSEHAAMASATEPVTTSNSVAERFRSID